MYPVRVASRSDSASFMSKRPKLESTMVSESDTRKQNEKRAAGQVRIIPIAVSVEVRRGDSLSALLLAATQSLGLRFQDGDILVVKHKVVSKAEGAVVALDDVRPSALSKAWARRHGLDARLSELALRESRRVVRRKRGVLITATKHRSEEHTSE